MINFLDLQTQKVYNSNLKRVFFKWYDVGVLGLGPSSFPFIKLDQYVQLPENKEDIVNEINNQLDQIDPNSGTGICLVPKHINNHIMPSYYSFNAEKYISPDILENITSTLKLDNLIYEVSPAVRIWEKTIMPRIHTRNYWGGKNSDSCEWVRNDFPLLRQWVESLRSNIFKQIGRVSIFKNNKNSPIWIHRDNPISATSLGAHFINFRLSNRKDRPFFIFDEIENKKYYITDSVAYMFNEWDPHGADSEDYDDFTVRIDGEFQPWLSSSLNFVNGKSWSIDYKSGKKIEDIKIYEPE